MLCCSPCILLTFSCLGNDVPFDGETEGNGAEVAGGPEIARPLRPDERATIDQVIRFDNAQVDNAQHLLGVQNLRGWANTAVEGFGSLWEAVVPRDHHAARHNILLQRHQPVNQQQERSGLLAGMFNIVRNVVRELNNASTSTARSTQGNHAAQARRRIERNLRTNQRSRRPRSHARASTARQPAETGRIRVTRSQTVRRTMNPQNVIDLTRDIWTEQTGEREVIDLTGED